MRDAAERRSEFPVAKPGLRGQAKETASRQAAGWETLSASRHSAAYFLATSMKTALAVLLLALAGPARSEDGSPWVRRLAIWARPELDALRKTQKRLTTEIAALPEIAGVNSANRTGFQSAGKSEGEDLWVELAFPKPVRADRVVLVPLLAKGASGQVPGFGFPRRFILDGTDADGAPIVLMNETSADFPPPGMYPVNAAVPSDTRLARIRLTATQPWRADGPPMLALAEMLVLDGNANVAWQASVRSSSSRELLPAWSRANLLDMVTPLGLPLAPDPDASVMGWHGAVANSMSQSQSFTVDLGQTMDISEIRLVPAWRETMAWDSYYGFPSRFKIEASLDGSFTDAVMLHDRTGVSLHSPGQNLQCLENLHARARYVRMTATRLRKRTGDYVFALGEMQIYSGGKNVALGAAVTADSDLDDPAWSPGGITDGTARGGELLELPEWFDKLETRRVLSGKLRAVTTRRAAVYSAAEHALVNASIGGASAIILVAGLFSWRGHRNQALNRERHRERLARDLHDELGSNLGSIALISSLAGEEGPEQMREDLAEIERVARESADSMRDMVSLLATPRPGETDWLAVMEGLAARLLRGTDLECRLPTAPLVWEPNLETRREIYLFCKEVLHNSAKHAHPGVVRFHLSPTSAGLRVVISDNGAGFDPALVTSGHGLGNLRERAETMRAEMTLDTAPDRGTTITLEVPRNRRWKKR